MMPDPAVRHQDDIERVAIELEPIDTLFFRDGRPFEAGSRASTRLPFPQTFAGAVRTWLAGALDVPLDRLAGDVKSGTSVEQAFAAFGPEAAGIGTARIRGPWFQVGGKTVVAMPANIRVGKEDDKFVRLDPLASAPPGWSGGETGMVPLWRRGRATVERATGYLDLEGVGRFLEGGLPEQRDVVPEDAIFGFDDRTGIGIDDATNTTGEGRIYAVRMLALRPGVRLLLEIEAPPATLAPFRSGSHVMPLGGEGRRVVMRMAAGAVGWPSVPASGEKGRIVLLTTPAYFGGWSPPGLQPLAAAVPGYDAVSGWDLARGGPKPTRFVVPAGSTYFLRPGDAAPAGGLVNDEEEARLGWGCFLEGNWNHV